MSERTKFNVAKDADGRTCDGIVFDSAIEMRYYREIILPGVASGKITHYELQKGYELQPKFKHDGKTVRAVVYDADFYIEYADGRKEVIDTKGFADSVAKLKRKMFWFVYPDIQYKWIAYSKIDGGFCDYEYVQKMRRERKKLKNKKEKQVNEQAD